MPTHTSGEFGENLLAGLFKLQIENQLNVLI